MLHNCFAKKVKKRRNFRQLASCSLVKEPTITILMWGIGYSLSQLEFIKVRQVLVKDDFKAKFRIKVRNRYSHSETLPDRFIFTEYCPQVFRNLRNKFGVNEQTYKRDLTVQRPYRDKLCMGRSGSIFLRSFNGEYLIKLIFPNDISNLFRMLQPYYEHIVDTRSETLLPRILGLYEVCCRTGRADTFPSGKKFFVVMSHSDPSAQIVYDLKGVELHRKATSRERLGKVCVLKDIDFIEAGSVIQIGDAAKTHLMDILSNDVQFLIQQHVVDYSLIICLSIQGSKNDRRSEVLSSIASTLKFSLFESNSSDDASNITTSSVEKIPVPAPPKVSTRLNTNKMRHSSVIAKADPVVSEVNQVIIRNTKGLTVKYHFNIIDIFTVYRLRQRLTRCIKIVRYGPHVVMSNACPSLYASRFLKFMDKGIQ